MTPAISELPCASCGEVFGELKQRGLRGVSYVVNNDHAGMVKAVASTPVTAWPATCAVRAIVEQLLLQRFARG